MLQRFYDPMRHAARILLRTERNSPSLHTTELVHQAVVAKLSGPVPRANDPKTFIGLVTFLMKQVIIERGQRRMTRLRYHNGLPQHDSALPMEWKLAIQLELARLQRVDPRAAQIVKSRILDQQNWEETAALAGVSILTARDDYEFAVGWRRTRRRH